MTSIVPGSVTSDQCDDLGMAFGLSGSIGGRDDESDEGLDLSINLRVEAGPTIFG